MLGTDIAALLCGLLLSRAWSLPGAGYVLVTLVVLTGADLYRLGISLRALEQVPRLVQVLAVGSLVLTLLTAATGLPPALYWQAAVTPVLVVLGRVASYALIRQLRRRGTLTEPVLILGGGKVARDLVVTLLEQREYGLVTVGYLDTEDGQLPIPRLGSASHLEELVEKYQVRRLLVAFSSVGEEDLVERVRSAVLRGVDVRVVPRFFDIGPTQRGTELDDISGIPLQALRPIAYRVHGWRLKRLLDIVGASAALFLLAPVLITCAIAVRVTSPGPILFRQGRIGQNGREFQMLKFRTLYEHASSHTLWSTADRSNQTSVGRILRRSNLDELPQLWNVLLGDMSIVGPRPERTYFVREFSGSVPGYAARHRVPGGMTGWAQVNGLRGDTKIAERVRLDNQYIEHWSLWRDVSIMLRTVPALLRRSE